MRQQTWMCFQCYLNYLVVIHYFVPIRIIHSELLVQDKKWKSTRWNKVSLMLVLKTCDELVMGVNTTAAGQTISLYPSERLINKIPAQIFYYYYASVRNVITSFSVFIILSSTFSQRTGSGELKIIPWIFEVTRVIAAQAYLLWTDLQSLIAEKLF
jgi:hypothetical protein